jgi:2-polyprenyl-3-methyl-5-hydroxy-6-metoxy-1,4-benzoquinol methylase
MRGRVHAAEADRVMVGVGTRPTLQEKCMTSSDHDQARRYYDRIADQYDSDFRRQGDLIDLREKEVLREQIVDWRGKRVLDFGCGTGRIAAFHLENEAASVLGVDISPRMIGIAKSKVDAPSIEFAVFDPADSSRILGDDQSFDVVTSLEVLEYFAQPNEFMSIIRSNLATTGCVVFDFINRQNMSAWLKIHLSRQWRRNELKLYTIGDIEAICEENGLKVTATNGVFMSLLPISIFSRMPLDKAKWLALERRFSRWRLLRKLLSYRVLVTAKLAAR